MKQKDKVKYDSYNSDLSLWKRQNALLLLQKCGNIDVKDK